MHARKSAPEFAGKTGARQDLLAGCEIFSNGTKNGQLHEIQVELVF